ncbi:MAG: CehA/McbA family metallohydrolase [Myxococcota bacterium]
MACLGLLACGGAVPPREAEYKLSEIEPTQELDPAALFAGRVTRANAERYLVGGPNAVGGVGDWALGNGRVCAVVSDPEHEAIVTPFGGLLVDLGHCGRADDQWSVLQLHLLNLSPRRIAPVERAAAALEDGEARIVTHGGLEGVEIETVYSVGTRVPNVLRVTSRLRRTGNGMRLFMVGDTTLHGRRSLAPFVISRPWPWISTGFDQPDADPNRIRSIVTAIHPADLHVLVGAEDDGPGVSYGVLASGADLISRDGKRRPLSFLALNGEHYTLQGVFTRPLWFGGRDSVGLLQFGQAPFMQLRKGESLEIRRVLILGERADAAVVTDRFFPDEPVVSGRVDDPRARIHVEEQDQLVLWTPFTVIRPGPDGSFSFRGPPGDYRLRVEAPGREPRLITVEVEDGDVALGDIETDPVATLQLPRGLRARLVFLGLEDTPDPNFRDDLLGFSAGGRPHRNSASSREVNLIGNDDDPLAVTLAPGRYRVLATRGPEFGVTSAELELAPGEERELVLEAPARAFETPGWIAADLHVHAGPSFDSTLSVASRVRAFAAQGGEVIVSTEHDFVVDYAPAIRAQGLGGEIASLVGTEVTSSAVSAEAPYTIGHSNVFPVPVRPLAYRQGALRAEGRRLRDVYRQAGAIARGTLVQLNHPRTPSGRAGDRERNAYLTHMGVSGKAYRPDRPLGAEPNAVLLERDPETGMRDLDFHLMELMNGSSRLHYRRARADWLSFLLQGELRTGTANSDSHDAATPVALPRSYVRVADDRPSALEPGAFLRALRTHHVVGTSGPWLEVSLEGAGPGDLYPSNAGTLRVRVEAADWVPVSELRVRVDGLLVHRGPIAPGGEQALPLRFDADALLTVEVEGEASEIFEALLPGGVPLAFANPVFVDADRNGQWLPPGLPSPRPAALRDPDRAP